MTTEEKLAWAEALISQGVKLMNPEQLGQWSGVRAWQETPIDHHLEKVVAAQDAVIASQKEVIALLHTAIKKP